MVASAGEVQRHSMRVAMITRDYPPTVGGVATATKSVVDCLRNQGVTVDVYEGGTNGRTATLPLREALRSPRYDIIHVQNGPFGAFAKHPLVVTLHATVKEEAKYYPKSRLARSPAAYLLERMALARADAIITDGEFTTKELVKDYGVDLGRISMIPLGVNLERFAPSEDRDEDHPRILTCSRLDPRKNIDETLVALSRMGDQSFELMVVGDGPEKMRLEELARRIIPRAKFTGIVPQQELYDLFSASAIYISSSRSEGFGLSVLQAMASASAVVASNIPAHRELITHGQDGLLYSLPEELVSFVRILLADKELVRRLGSNARRHASSHSWENVARSTVSVYHRVLDSHASGHA